MKMQRQSCDHEQKPIQEETRRHRSLFANPVVDQETVPNKSSPWRHSTRTNLLNAHSEIKRRNALSTIPLKNYDDLLEIRSIRQPSKPAQNIDEQSLIVTINVSGDRFQTHLSTLHIYPNTLLGDENKRKCYWNPETEEYFFDRNRSCFEAILYYYQSHGRLRRPDFVPLDTFLEEISFFELGTEASAQVHQMENLKAVKKNPLPRALWRRYIWFYVEYPQHSFISRAINLMSTFFTILSCISLAIESLPIYTDHWDNICKLEANISLNSTFTPRCSALFTSPFFLIQTVCVLYFTIEFLLRFISTPSYYRFVFSFFNWVDLGTIVPYFVFLSIQLADKDIGLESSAILWIRILRVLRFSRIFKLYVVFQKLKSLRVLTATVKESLTDFAVMITILTLVAFLFGAATYVAEQQDNGDVFDSIPKSIYWGIITITGVGYGDMCPITPVGRVLTCLCALAGPTTMGMLVSVLVDRYQRVYNRKLYISEPDTPVVDFDMINDSDDDTTSVFSLPKLSERRNFSGILEKNKNDPYGDDITSAFSLQKSSRRRKFSRILEKSKNDPRQAYELQFVVSFNDDNNRDRSASDHIVTVMKRKLTEVISTSDIDVNLKLIDNDCREVWTISSANTPSTSISDLPLSTNIYRKQQSKIEVF